jgi:hypothetical protein
MATDLEIYKQTQELAMLIASGYGCVPIIEGDHSGFVHNSNNPRIAGFFATAVKVQEFLNNHEMSDVIDSYEEQELDQIELSEMAIAKENGIKSWAFKRPRCNPASGNMLAKTADEAIKLVHYAHGFASNTEVYCAENDERKIDKSKP